MPAAGDNAKKFGDSLKTLPNLGDTLPDGSAFVGFSPHTNRPLYMATVDVPMPMTLAAAGDFAPEFQRNTLHWKEPARLPSAKEWELINDNLRNRFNALHIQKTQSDTLVEERYLSSSVQVNEKKNFWGKFDSLSTAGSIAFFPKDDDGNNYDLLPLDSVALVRYVHD